MAKTSNNPAVFFLQRGVVVAVFALLLAAQIANARVHPKTFLKTDGVACQTVYGVQSGDTCFSITEALKLNQDLFSAINPNLNCKKLFVGQWLCVNGVFN